MICATNNKEKIKELKDILDIDIKSLKEMGINLEVVEDEDTFYGNALKKAKAVYEITHEDVIADDSGLCIKSLNNFPGVLTSRFLGDNKTDEEKNLTLIEMTKEKKDKSAKVVCNLVYYNGKDILVGKGEIFGKITDYPRGDNGFGFDPIFELENGKTLAELSSRKKNMVSARYIACLDLKQKINSLKNNIE